MNTPDAAAADDAHVEQELKLELAAADLRRLRKADWLLGLAVD